MRILHTISSLSRAAGGPSRSVTSLCNHLGEINEKIDLLAVGCEEEQAEWVLPNPDTVILHFVVGRKLPGLNVPFCPNFGKQIARIHDKYKISIIHDHGLWLPNNYASVKAAKSLDIPWVVSTRGMLEPWAFSYRGWKKKIVWGAWQKCALEGAAALHATSLVEADNLRALGLSNPIAIIPNGVDLPELKSKVKKEVKTALFLSRIHPVKGLLNLVNAWAKVKPNGWKMVIAGPSEEENHEEEVKRAIESAGLTGHFDFLGPVNDHLKWDLFSQADLFVLPSYSENFGIVVAEALASEIPVITTKGTPWNDLITKKCGWWVDVGVEPLAEALNDAMSLSDNERHKMGQRGRALVEQHYSWGEIANNMTGVYQWLSNSGARPDCVYIKN